MGLEFERIPDEDYDDAPVAEPPSTSAIDLPDVNVSGMERLRQRYDQLDEGEEKFTIPAYGELIEGVGMVWPFLGRYRRLNPAEIREIKKAVQDHPDPGMEFNIRMLAESCIELGTRGEPTVEEPDGEFVPLSNDPDHPIRWDRQLAKGLGFTVDAPATLEPGEVMRGAFKGNLQAINEHSADVYGWMLYGRAVVLSKEEEEAGKAPSAPPM